MDVAVDNHRRVFGRAVAGPHAGISQIETLVGREAVDGLQGLLLHAVQEGTIGDVQSAVVAHVLAEGLLAVHLQSGQRLLLREPVGDDLGALVVVGLVLGRPPVGQVTILVELTALVVEAVSHLVAHDDADGTIVRGIVGLGVEERWLQDGSGEVDAVEQRVIEGVDRLGRARHLGLVDGLAPVLAQVGLAHLLVDADEVLDQVFVFADIDILLHILPFVGIAGVDVDGVQLLQRLGLGRVAHPGILLQAVLESLLQVFDELHHALLATLGEELLDIEFADGLAQATADGADGTLPAGLLLLNTRDGLVGLEHAVAEGVREETRVGVDDVQLHVGLEVFEWRVGQHILHHVQGLQLAHVDHVDILGIAQGVAIGHPVEALEVLEQLVPGHDVDGLLWVALVHLVQGLDADLVLDGPFGLHHALGVGVVIAHHLEEVLVEGLDGVDGGQLLLVGVVVILLWQRGATMTGRHLILRRVIGVEAESDAEGSRVEAQGVELIHQLQSLLAGLDVAHLLEVG